MSYNAPQAYGQPTRTSTLAIISLVSGIVGFVAIPLLGSIAAVITGHMAKGEIRTSGGTVGGDGLATAGLILGYIGLGLAVLGLCAFVLWLIFIVGFFGIAATQNSFLPALPFLL